jgi:hypothetical protein
MENIILIVTATCRTNGCSQENIPHSYEQESNIDSTVSCGQCQNVIDDITSRPKA